MNNLMFYNARRITSFALMGTITLGAVTLTSCNKQETKENEFINEEALVNSLKNSLKTLVPEATDEVVEDTALILLLDVLAPKDANEKMDAKIISHFKSIINEDVMMENFNSFLTMYEDSILLDNKKADLSSALPESLEKDKLILSHIENITNTILNSTDSKVINAEFNKLYTLFVNPSPENKITVDGLEFGIRDLSYGVRAIAQSYPRLVISYEPVKEIIPEEKREKIDARTNNQDNKAYIKSDLKVLANQVVETSEIDVVGAFNSHYLAMENYIDCKVNLSRGEINNLVNVLNLNYLSSDKVSTADRNKILGRYDNEKINTAIESIVAIDKYNHKNQNEMLTYSEMLLGEYKKTPQGRIDAVALDFIQYNSEMLLNTTTKKSTFNEVFNNPYFQNIYKYLTKQDFTHKYPDGTTYNISWQEISDEANLYNNLIVLLRINELPNIKGKDSYLEKAKMNLGESVQAIQITITGECEKVNIIEFIKLK